MGKKISKISFLCRTESYEFWIFCYAEKGKENSLWGTLRFLKKKKFFSWTEKEKETSLWGTLRFPVR